MDGEAIRAGDVRDAEALLVRTRTACTASLLEGSRVRFIGTATIGKDHIDIPWCDSKGITWASAPGCNADAVCQYVVCTLLAISSRHGISLEGASLGVIGVGEVGSRVAKAARLLGMQVFQNDPPRAEREGRKGFESLVTLQRECDFLTLHVPLDKAGAHPTWRLANASFLSKLQPHAWLINTSRGPVVDNTALRIALRSSSIAGAVLDVWENEPDAIDQDLLGLVELGTPHIAGYSLQGKANATSQVIQALGKTLGIPALWNWKVSPELIGTPANPTIRLDGRAFSDSELLQQAVFQTYDLRSDDEALRDDPEHFEDLRSRYDYRHEFPSYMVEVVQGSGRLVAKLRGLGFQVKL